MHKNFTLLLFLLLSSICSIAQLTITTDSVLQTGTCAGSSIIIRYKTAGGNFGTGNRFTAQLSNAFGQFTSPVNIGSSVLNLGFILASIPKTATFGFLYRIRVVSSNPAVIGSQSPNTIIVTSTALTATINTPNGTSLCPGDSLTLQAFLPNSTYQWSTGAKTQSIRVGSAGSYWVKVTDPLGCDARDTVDITPKPNCVININILSIYPNPTPANGVVTLRGIPPGYSAHFIDFSGRTAATMLLNNNSQVRLGRFLPSGVYYIVVQKGDERLNMGKLVVVQ